MEPTGDWYPSGRANTTTDDGRPKERKRVGFSQPTTPATPDYDIGESSGRGRSEEILPNAHRDVSPFNSEAGPSAPDDILPERFQRPSVSEQDVKEIHSAFDQPYVSKPRPAIRKAQTGGSPNDIELEDMTGSDNNVETTRQFRAGADAHERASKLAARLGSNSAPVSRRNSGDSKESPHGTARSTSSGHNLDGPADKRATESDDDVLYQKQTSLRLSECQQHTAAQQLVRNFTRSQQYYDVEDTPLHSGQNTPAQRRHSEDYVERPTKYLGGIMGALMQLRGSADAVKSSLGGSRTPPDKHAHRIKNSAGGSVGEPGEEPGLHLTPPASGATTPKSGIVRHFREKAGNRSPKTIAQLAGSSSTLALPPRDFAQQVTERLKHETRPEPRRRSLGSIPTLFSLGHQSRQEEYRITVHIADIMLRQRYLLMLCKMLMITGAPTHRMEEYMRYSARALEIQAQFMYLPGCMIISFDDSATHTAEVKLVKANTAINLGNLRDVHDVYKEVLHDAIDVDEATQRLEAIMKRKPRYSRWFFVFMYGLASVTVGPFAFQARFVDLPIAFVLGCFLGILQLIVAPKSDLYANVFEISASVLTSFLARAFGSIRFNGTYYFCFSALAQSSIALILPGYTVLCAALELQSKQIVPGSIRLVYAILYSLFLGFGITIGTVIFGLMDKGANSATTCENPLSSWWDFLFVPGFTLCLIVINQAKWKQAPFMLVVSSAGYAVNYFAGRYVKGNAQISNTLGAFVIGLLANLYSRLGLRVENWFLDVWEQRLRPVYQKMVCRRYFARNARHRHHHQSNNSRRRSSTPGEDNGDDVDLPKKRKLGYGLAAAAMLPAIFVQVPSGLAVNGSLLSGITSANQILSNSTGTNTATGISSPNVNSTALDFGFSVIQIAIGITVGLFLAALAVYPFGKRRSGLFSF